MQRSMLLAAPIIHGHEEVVLELAATEVASLALEGGDTDPDYEVESLLNQVQLATFMTVHDGP